MKPVHKRGAIIGLGFGIVSMILIYLLRIQGAFLVIILWMLVPVAIKKISDRLR